MGRPQAPSTPPLGRLADVLTRWRRARRRRRRRERDLHNAPAGWAPENLAKPGLDPRTVVDIGVGPGTPQLYAAFPQAHHFLVEPLAEFEPELQEILRTYRGGYCLTAVGAEAGTARIHVEPDQPTKSSIHSRTALTTTGSEVEPRTIPVATLDQLARDHDLRPPYGLKIDTEGFELQVIRGATRFLEEAQFVIAEVSVSRRFEGSYDFAEFIAAMAERRFRLCDVLAAPRNRRAETMFVDAMFRPATGP